MRNIPFASITDNIAKELVGVLLAQRAASKTDQMAVKILGEWRQRRFSISGIGVNVFFVTAPIRDVVNKFIIVPVVNDPEFYVNVLRGFGMAVQFAARKADEGVELVSADVEDGEFVGHLVSRWHHVAACGFKGPWVLAAGAPVRKICCACANKFA